MSRAVSPISTHHVLLFFHLPQAFCILTESMTRGTILTFLSSTGADLQLTNKNQQQTDNQHVLASLLGHKLGFLQVNLSLF